MTCIKAVLLCSYEPLLFDNRSNLVCCQLTSTEWRVATRAVGIDINPRFTGCQAYEFTDEVGIFDLLDIPLLHGWLVDPQVRACVPV